MAEVAGLEVVFGALVKLLLTEVIGWYCLPEVLIITTSPGTWSLVREVISSSSDSSVIEPEAEEATSLVVEVAATEVRLRFCADDGRCFPVDFLGMMR